MVAFRVVEHLDVIEHISPHGILRRVDPPPDPLALEQGEEAFHGRVVVAVAASAHAAQQTMGRQETLSIVADVDRTLV